MCTNNISKGCFDTNNRNIDDAKEVNKAIYLANEERIFLEANPVPIPGEHPPSHQERQTILEKLNEPQEKILGYVGKELVTPRDLCDFVGKGWIRTNSASIALNLIGRLSNSKKKTAREEEQRQLNKITEIEKQVENFHILPPDSQNQWLQGKKTLDDLLNDQKYGEDQIVGTMECQKSHWVSACLKIWTGEILWFDGKGQKATEYLSYTLLKKIAQKHGRKPLLRRIKFKQTDDDSCGIHALLFLKYQSIGKEVTWTSQHSHFARLRFLADIIVRFPSLPFL